jgi:protocatechuate 3,4-dioxygenase beta subunit
MTTSLRAIAFLGWTTIATGQGTLARLEGLVLNTAGLPLSGAALQLGRGVPVDRAVMPIFGRVAPATVTDAEGRFEFHDLPSGHYSLSVEKAGFAPLRAGTAVEVEVPSAMPVTIRLTPQSVIAGRVTEEHGDPVEGVQVTAIGEYFIDGRKEWRNLASARTDDRGVYRLTGLKNGRYRIGAWRSRENGGTSVTYYPNADEIIRGTLIRVREGESLSSIDIQATAINRRYRIRGVAVGEGGNIQPSQYLTLRSRDGFLITAPRTLVKNDGTFEFSNVTPRRYFVETLLAWASGGGTSAMWSDVGRAAVTVTNVDVDNVRILVGAGYEISGRASDLDKFGKLPRITLVDVEGSLAGGDASTQVALDGSFQLRHVMGGQFIISVTDLPKGTYVQSVRYGDRDVTHSMLALPATAEGALNIVLAANAASVTGSTVGPGSVIALWPINPDAGQVLGSLRVAMSDENGAFLFDHLRPGEYKVIAWDGIETGIAQYAPFNGHFANKATTLTLSEGSAAKAEVPLISRAEVDAIIDDLL